MTTSITANRLSILRCISWMVLILILPACARAEMEAIIVSADKKGFVEVPSGKTFLAWGNNYSADVMARLAADPTRVERDFAEMKTAGANVVRVSPEMPAFFSGPDQIAPYSVDRLRNLLSIAEKNGLRLHITGLACFRIKQRMGWYDALKDEQRWKTQALFWETIAKTCASSHSVFGYDLVNEPAPVGKPSDGWYMGRMGDFEFCQRLSLDPHGSGDDVFRHWVGLMVDAIRKQDKTHLITIGMLPFPGAYKAVAEQLDFVSPHIYPESKKVPQAIELLKKFDFGKPIEMGETFPLSCGAEDERKFLLQSKSLAAGWVGHWPEEGEAALREIKKNGKLTLNQSIWLSWVDLFEEVGPEMRK